MKQGNFGCSMTANPVDICCDSITATVLPARLSSLAGVIPAIPAPTIATSTDRLLLSGEN